MQVLSIGNSFSQDATHYLAAIARAQGEKLTSINLMISSCPLERHFRNMKSGEEAYMLEHNGAFTGFFVSLDKALLSRSWDVITLQQASPSSFRKETYQPYLHALVSHIREYCLEAKLCLHQTWAYGEGSKVLADWYSRGTAEDMFREVFACYEEAKKEEGFDGLIPSGELMLSLLRNGIPSIHRDNVHLSLGLGRYAAGLLWFRMLTGKSVAENTFRDFDEPIPENEIALAKRLADTFAPLI